MSEQTETKTNGTSLTLEQAWTLWQVAQAEVAEAQHAEHEALRTVARAAGGKTFMHDGQLYQVRERKMKGTDKYVPFICALARPPAEWLAEARAAKYAEQAAAAPESTEDESTETMAVDVEPPAPIAGTGSGNISGAALFDSTEPPAESTIVLD